MNNKFNHISVFEHQTIKVGQLYDDVLFTEIHRLKLASFYGEKGVLYYSLTNNGVKFNNYVGVIQIGSLTIEVLPKADKYDNKSDWQKILIGMLNAVGAFHVHAPSSSALSIKSNFILDLYFELFIKEVEYLYNKGLVKKYRRTQGNMLALKGNIQFGKHLQQNLVHQERFYISHSTYDHDHLIHQILYEALLLLDQINTNFILKSRIGSLLLNFPEMKKIKVTEALFNKLVLNIKTVEYKSSLEISKLLLLNYHPDLSNGHNNVLALMFDMNLLWEKFIYISLRKQLKDGMTITSQTTKSFWHPDKGYNSRIKPDIIINKEAGNTIVLDTKWKNIGDKNPSPDDLRQLYVYHDFYKAKRVALIYPGIAKIISGYYYKTEKEVLSDKECSVITIPTNKTIAIWQEEIQKQIFDKWE